MQYAKRLLVLAVIAAGAAACDDEGSGPNPLLAPTNVAGVYNGESDAVIITWTASTSADSYTVERDMIGDSDGFAAIGRDLTGTSYTDDDVAAGMTYQYRVVAIREADRAVSGAVEVAIGSAAAQITGTVSADRTLYADTTYTLSGIVTVDEGATLTIEAGTTILGDVDVAPSALIVRRGGRLVAEGTADAPIVFTSSRPVGARARGDWGGIVLNGRSICNFPAGECIGEGSSGEYGGDVLDDDSGVLKYVRIEFAGYEVSFGSELNALTLNGVGSGTEIDYIQVHYGSDDGIEWFGGTVNVKHALATGISDDSFDFSTGWQGKGQFWIAQQDPNDADNGWEVDNNEGDYDATPRTSPAVYNVTLIGKGPNGAGGTAGESTRGMLLRRGIAGDIYNAIVTGFGGAGLDIDNEETLEQCVAGTLIIGTSIFFSNAAFTDDDDDNGEAAGSPQYEDGCFSQPGWSIQQVDPQLAAPFDRVAPDFRPAASSPAASGASAPPSDGFFETVDYIGAAAPAGTEWYEGWTTTAVN